MFEYLREINIFSIILRVFLALIIGGLLGWERGIKNRPAGFKTYMLVCLGATLVMMTNQYVYQTLVENSDPVRLGAQVISGIGFLGAGSIIVTKKSRVQGITTAAALWVAACLGLVIGIGFYEAALVGIVAVFIVMVALNRVDKNIKNKGRVINLYIEFDALDQVAKFISFLHVQNFEVIDMRLSNETHNGGDNLGIILSIVNNSALSNEGIVKILSRESGVDFVEEI